MLSSYARAAIAQLRQSGDYSVVAVRAALRKENATTAARATRLAAQSPTGAAAAARNSCSSTEEQLLSALTRSSYSGEQLRKCKPSGS
jgi:Arc/MetJ-type ribon-helix-helix transcriptional regulator